MPRPIAFDITHLISRLPVSAPSGIDKVDMAYARHFAANPAAAAVHYGLRGPRFHPGATVAEALVAATRDRWAATHVEADRAYADLYRWLTGSAPAAAALEPQSHRSTRQRSKLSRLAEQSLWRLRRGSVPLPEGAIYLNAAQHAFEAPLFFRWLTARPDVLPVFLVHDFLPLDFPEYFKPGYKSLFSRRVETILRHAKAIITTSRDVACRIGQEYERQKARAVPVHVEPLPSSLHATEPGGLRDRALSQVPYFVVLGTIEPRKNHLMLLNVWRQIAEHSPNPPKLVVAGVRGWENEQVLDILDRSLIVKPHVREVRGLGDTALLHLIANARGLLMPSFAEGYGLPVVEALSVGTPVVASDIAVFREVGQERALLRHPLDGPGWRQAIEALSDEGSPVAAEARSLAHSFEPPSWPRYFAGVDGFLKSL